MTSSSSFDVRLADRSPIFGLKLWVIVGISIGAFLGIVLFILSLWLSLRYRSKRLSDKQPSSLIPMESKDIKEVKVDKVRNGNSPRDDLVMSSSEMSNTEKEVVRFHYPDASITILETDRSKPDVDKSIYRSEANGRQCKWKRQFDALETAGSTVDKVVVAVGERRGSIGSSLGDVCCNVSGDSPSGRSPGGSAIPELSHLGWGHWYTFRELEIATNFFSDNNILGEGGFGIVYQGKLPDGSLIAVKNLLNNRGQAEKEFKVEVEAVGRVRHKNLVRLIGYCAEGSHRMLVFEYMDNGNLDQWLHGKLGQNKTIPWEGRMKIILGTAKGLAYLHEGLEPTVVHRDVKSSNILLDTKWNAKITDFGLAKLLCPEKSHVTTRVMGTFGYVAPEYANTGFLTQRSDVYSFGVLLMEIITGRDPVDYDRPSGEVNLVDWLKVMVGNRRSEDVADTNLEVKPTARSLKRALLVALRCVDPDAEKRPKMSHVVHMLESNDFPFRSSLDRTSSRENALATNGRHHQQMLRTQNSLKDSPAR